MDVKEARITGTQNVLTETSIHFLDGELRREFDWNNQKILKLYDYPLVVLASTDLPSVGTVTVPLGAIANTNKETSPRRVIQNATDDPLIVKLARAAIRGEFKADGPIDLKEWR